MSTWSCPVNLHIRRLLALAVKGADPTNPHRIRTHLYTKSVYQACTGICPKTWPRSWAVGTACRTPSRRTSWQRSGRPSGIRRTVHEIGSQVEGEPDPGVPPRGRRIHGPHTEPQESPVPPTAITAQSPPLCLPMRFRKEAPICCPFSPPASHPLVPA